jgi:hypothetical protein
MASKIARLSGVMSAMSLAFHLNVELPKQMTAPLISTPSTINPFSSYLGEWTGAVDSLPSYMSSKTCY